MARGPSISVSGRTYARLRTEAARRGVTMLELVELALGYAVSNPAKTPARPSLEIRVESTSAAWARKNRERNDAAGLCLNENRRGTHGKATHGKLCKSCRETHRGAPRELPIAAVVARVFATIPIEHNGVGLAQRSGSARRISAMRHDALERDHGITVDASSGLYVRKARVA